MSQPLYVYSERPLLVSLLLATFSISVVSAFFGLAFPSTSTDIAVGVIVIAFVGFTMVLLVLLLESRRYEFFSDSMIFYDGFHDVHRIQYDKIVQCRPVYNAKSLFGISTSEEDKNLNPTPCCWITSP